ncbi:MAG: hypothetical protein HKN42_00630 [Granulosicoccus sp.]|nr:hypothetical protein [Granulosicoccus sp.]
MTQTENRAGDSIDERAQRTQGIVRVAHLVVTSPAVAIPGMSAELVEDKALASEIARIALTGCCGT